MGKQEKVAALCKGGCGFYGSAHSEGFCSKCFKAFKEEQDTATFSPSNYAERMKCGAVQRGQPVGATPVKSYYAISRIVDSSYSSIAVQEQPDTVSPTAASDGPGKTPIRCPHCNGVGFTGFCSECFKASLKELRDNAARINPNNSDSYEGMKCEPVKYVPGLAVKRGFANRGGGIRVKSYYALPRVGESMYASPVEPLDRCSSCNAAPEQPSVTPSAAAAPSGPGKTPKRCQMCRKRVGLYGFRCRCGGMYCIHHRYGTEHNCDFDYKTMEREELKKNNPTIVCEKIQRI